MTIVVLILMGLLGFGCLALWHPKVEMWTLRYPWWVPVGAPSVVLGITALLASRITGPPGSVEGDIASVFGVLIAISGGGPVTIALLRGVERAGVPGVSDSPDLEQPFSPVPTGGDVLRGGAWIGVLERGAIAAALLVSLPEGVAITIAIKGLARYPELRVVGASERFIIGTFSSGLWAAAAAGVATLVRQ